jgi:predicted DCC family thiol-disulfide oxidoreductase YuxK
MQMLMLNNAWSGGQYSLFRVIFGGTLFFQFATGTPFGLGFLSESHAIRDESTGTLDPLFSTLLSASNSVVLVPSLLAFGALTSVALAIGYRDRIAALVLSLLCASLMTPELLLSNPGLLFFAGLLVAHALTPTKPFGSWDARGRLDPDGGWRMPNILYLSAWVLLMLGYLYLGTAHFLNSARFVAADLWPGFLLLHLFTFNPGWVASRHTEGHTIVFYDGACGLCHQTIRILLAEDALGLRFRFAPLESELFRAARAEPGSGFTDVDPVPDSVLVQRPRPDQAMTARSEGVLELGHQLGGLWRLASTILGWLPSSLLDASYDFIARVRHRLFTRPEDSCPLLPPHLRARFSD